MFPVTITINNQLQLNAVLAALLEKAPAAEQAPGKPAPTPAAKPASPAPGPRTAKAEAVAAPAKTDTDSAPAAAPVVAQPPASTAATEATPAVDYPTLQKAVAKLFAKDSKAPVVIAKDLGFDTFKAMPADAWSKALAAVNSKLAELEIA